MIIYHDDNTITLDKFDFEKIIELANVLKNARIRGEVNPDVLYILNQVNGIIRKHDDMPIAIKKKAKALENKMLNYYNDIINAKPSSPMEAQSLVWDITRKSFKAQVQLDTLLEPWEIK